MDIVNVFTPETTAFIGVFSLAWLLVGIVLGRMMKSPHHAGEKKHRDFRGRKGDLVEIYVGNLSYDVNDRDLQSAFEEYGNVASSRIIKNRLSGKSKGFGFIEMADRSEAGAAISALNGKDYKGRRIVVNEAKSRSR